MRGGSSTTRMLFTSTASTATQRCAAAATSAPWRACTTLTSTLTSGRSWALAGASGQSPAVRHHLHELPRSPARTGRGWQQPAASSLLGTWVQGGHRGFVGLCDYRSTCAALFLSPGPSSLECLSAPSFQVVLQSFLWENTVPADFQGLGARLPHHVQHVQPGERGTRQSPRGCSPVGVGGAGGAVPCAPAPG